MAACQDDESNPRPLRLQNKVNCDQESHLRSPLSSVSDSFGHENEVDISKSSEEKTSATGSNVAPRRKGSLFSPMEKDDNKKRGSPLLHRGWELSTRGEKKRTVCADHLGVRRAVVFIGPGGRGWSHKKG